MADTTAGTGAEKDPIGALAFDDALVELQRTVVLLEQGGLPLEESIVLYERGVALHERCAALLADAELRVRKLVERAGGAIQTQELVEDQVASDERAPASQGRHER